MQNQEKKETGGIGKLSEVPVLFMTDADLPSRISWRQATVIRLVLAVLLIAALIIKYHLMFGSA